MLCTPTIISPDAALTQTHLRLPITQGHTEPDAPLWICGQAIQSQAPLIHPQLCRLQLQTALTRAHHQGPEVHLDIRAAAWLEDERIRAQAYLHQHQQWTPRTRTELKVVWTIVENCASGVIMIR
jgi:hypothetical protein